ncbi:hypothetical protein ESCO_003021 [Escovopsis weberi]|uniref:PH domain-containing protein n=1 Tax=Escovopsis weberi TaxID=150374 RepID=A0A0M8MWJ2_ESCWE|nr:hypothetical protein ESCO_003021 [Escovopsis weberi]
MSQYTTFDAIQGHHTTNLKMRSSESDLASEDGDFVPSRQGKLGRRESILGIRNIFGRSNKKEADAASLSKASRSSSIRASIAEISPWSHGQPNRSETVLPSTASSPDDLMQERPDPSQRAPTPIGATRRKPGSAAAAWTMPPLSKAYLRAIKHGVLPAPTLSADAILRSHEKKNSPVTAETVALADQLAADVQVSDMDKLKRKLRGDALATHNLQWTSKIYVLLPAGCLLQYPGEGHHDRLPEKVLRLGHSSAAFASDLIPGRHWVLQVSSSTDNDGSPQTESRSLFSKLQFRIPDRRTTANLLMVFEGAEDMKEWIATLRTEIEKMGSSKELADIAATAEKDLDVDSASQGYALGHPISLKKSSSFLNHRNAPLMEEDEEEAAPRPSNASIAATDCDGGMQDSSLDDVSVTNSIISHDGRQLDSLRESSHRFSYLSSGQRTVMTSTNSSPAASPVMERFPRLSDADSDAAPSRRTSWQAISPLSDDGRHDTIPEGCPATFVSAPPPNRGDALHHASGGSSASGRRASSGKTAPSEPDASPSPSGLKGGLSLFPRPSIRRQLGAIRVSRPLSTVEDQPSPKENIDMPERPITSHHAGSQPPTPPEDVPDLPSEFLMPGAHASGFDSSMTRSLGRRTGLATGLKHAQSVVPSNGPRGRRLSSFSSLRKQAGTSDSPHREGEGSRPSLSIRVCPNYASQTHLRRSSVEASETSHLHAALSRAAKRASIASFCSDKPSSGEMRMSLEIPPMPAPPPSKALPPIPQRPSTSGRGKLSRKNSMPHVVEGPPPAPPPTCALPPIPIPRK